MDLSKNPSHRTNHLTFLLPLLYAPLYYLLLSYRHIINIREVQYRHREVSRHGHRPGAALSPTFELSRSAQIV